MNLRGLLKLAVIAFVVWYVYRNPSGAADTARAIWDQAWALLTTAATSAAAFLDGLAR